MNWKYLLIFFIFVVLVGGGVLIYQWWEGDIYPPPLPPITELEPEEYVVYKALIVQDGIGPDKLIVIEKKTVGGISTVPGELDSIIEFIKEGMPEINQKILNDFKNKNSKSYQLGLGFDLGVDYWLIGQEEMEEIFEKGESWDDFYKKYSNAQGIMTLSRVGFNSEKNQALVYMGNQSHGEAGAGFYYLLAKENSVWKVKNKIMAWIS